MGGSEVGMTPKKTATLLTAEQRLALDAHDRSVSLAAGAGCGKTFVLTERFLSYLDPSVLGPVAELTELVAITFTDAAAREMRERIRNRCYQRLQEASSEGEKQSWQQLIPAMDEARISTIHSFCATLLRRYAAEAAVDPHFELLSGPAAELLRIQTLDNRLRQLLIANHEPLIELATRFGLQNLRDIIADLLSKNTSRALELWGTATSSELVAVWRQHHAEHFVPAAVQHFLAEEPVSKLRELCQTSAVSKETLQDRFQEILSLLEKLKQEPDSVVALLGQLHDMARVQGVCQKVDWSSEEEFNHYRDACSEVRKLTKKSPLQRPLDDAALEQTAAVGLDLLHLVADVSTSYKRVKQWRSVLEFDDLLVKTYRLLTNEQFPAIQRKLNQSMRLLMVDEFQDTDPLQVAIVQALCGEQWAEQGLFVVGDFKQSIYRFRGAEPEVSDALRAHLPAASRLSLTTNFRSQPAILDFVNALFCEAFEQTYEPLVAHRSQQAPLPAVEFLWSCDQQDVGNGVQPAEFQQHALHRSPAQRERTQEARFIARRLSQLLDEAEPIVVDQQSRLLRPLQLGDIAILLRSLSDVNIYEEALREYGLDYYLTGGHAFYAQQEIHDVLHLLRAVASLSDDLSLAGALRSPLFSLEDETLFWLVEAHGSLGSGLFATALPPQLSDAECAKVRRASSTLQGLRAIKDCKLVAELLRMAIAQTGYDAILLAEFMGQRKLANVHKLLEQARSHDRSNPGDLDGFITQLSEFVVRTPKEPLAASRAECDVIRIMTIHNSKGLEFGLVVVPDLGRKSPHASSRPVFDEKLGPLVSPETASQHGNCCAGWNMHQFAEQQHEMAERNRLLYVACTRAADRLILSSSFKDLEKDLENPSSAWLKFLAKRFCLQSGQCIVDLPTNYCSPQVLVTTDLPPTERKPMSKSRGVDLIELVEKTNELVQRDKGTVPGTVEPVPVDVGDRKRFSFSQLTGQLIETIDSDAQFSGLASQRSNRAWEAMESGEPVGLDSKDLGTLVHAVLERVEVGNPSEVQELCDFLSPLYFEEDWQQAAILAGEMIGRFLVTDRAQEIARAKTLCREVEFLLPWSLQEESWTGCYFHGFIDCLYQDAVGDWHLLDYKSNRVSAEGVPQQANHYAMQMFVYSLACQQSLGVLPVENTLLFLRPTTEFGFTWQDSERSAMAKRIDQAIRSQSSMQNPPVYS